MTYFKDNFRLAYIRFQLTRSRGAWQIASSAPKSTFTFQLTRSRGAWLTLATIICQSIIFQLTRSRGAWLCRFCYLLYLDYFNSHAHVEHDVWLNLKQLKVLKFQLTRSRGAWHDIFCPCSRIFQFQLTRSRGAWQLFYCHVRVYSYFNSHAHVEHDIRKKYPMQPFTNFNSHAHVEHDLCNWY